MFLRYPLPLTFAVISKRKSPNESECERSSLFPIFRVVDLVFAMPLILSEKSVSINGSSAGAGYGSLEELTTIIAGQKSL